MNEPAGVMLLVDDDEAKRYVLATWLRRAGHTVVEVGTGQEALDQADKAERPGGFDRRDADLGEVLGLMHLHGVPRNHRQKIADCDPPEPGGAQRPAKRPFGCRPRPIDGHCRMPLDRCARRGAIAIRFLPHVGRIFFNEERERRDSEQNEPSHRDTGCTPAFREYDGLQPG